MALVTVVGSGTTAGTTLLHAWRKSQGMLLKGYQSENEEMALLKSAQIPTHKIAISAREITNPIDIKRPTHAAIIPEGGYEGNPVTVGMNEITLTWSNYNIRFSTTLTAKYLAKLGQDNAITSQFKYQAMKAVEGLAETVSRDWYGFSTGVWCQTSTVATQASGVYTTKNIYGLVGVGSTAAGVGSMFQVGDRVALIRTGALVANAIGTITAITPATPSITVTWIGSVTSADLDNIVLAGSIENATIAGTNFNKALVGMRDGLTTASIHGLSSATEPLWAAGYSDTGGGRWSGVKLRKAKQGMRNLGGGEPNLVIWDQGVSNDVFASQSGALRFTDAQNMPLDGAATDTGIKFFDSRKVIPGDVLMLDTRNSVKKFNLLDYADEGSVTWDDGDKMEGQNALAFSIDMPIALVWTNRGNAAFFSGLSTQ